MADIDRARLTGWIATAQRLAQEVHQSSLADEIGQLSRPSPAKATRIGVIGEFGRGKSTLVNALLGRDLVPVGFVPTTSAVITIANGPEERLQVRFPGGYEETRPLDASAWNDLIELDDRGEKEYPIAHITVPSPWLEESGAELIDMPGLNVGGGLRQELVEGVLQNCDVVAFTISGTTPFSMVERYWLEALTTRFQIKQIVVVLTHLDQTGGEEQRVTAHIQSQLRTVAPSVTTILPIYPSSDPRAEAAIDAIRVVLFQRYQPEQREVWQMRRTAGQLKETLDRVIRLAEVGLQAQRLSEQEQREMARRTEQAVSKARLALDHLTVELNGRQVESQREITAAFQAARVQVHAEMRNLIQKHATLDSDWIRKGLVTALRQSLVTAMQTPQELFITTATEDMRWLVEVCQRQLDQSMQPLDGIPHVQMTIRVDPLTTAANPGGSLEQGRVLARVTAVASFLFSAFMFKSGRAIVALMGVFGVGASLITDQFLGSRLTEQRKQVQRLVDQQIDQVMDQQQTMLLATADALYDQWSRALSQGVANWSSAQQAVMTTTTRSSVPWEEILHQAQTLTREIDAALR